jgi:hypothetical protein
MKFTGKKQRLRRPNSRLRSSAPSNGGNCVQPEVSRGCCATPICAMRRAGCSPISTTGSHRASIPPTEERQGVDRGAERPKSLTVQVQGASG